MCFDGLFGGDKTATTTASTQYSPFVTGAQQNLAAGAFNGMVPYLSNPTAQIAPMNTSQNVVGNSASNLLNYAQNTQGIGNGYDYSSEFANGRGDLDPYIAYSDPGYYKDAIGSSTFDNNDIMAFANPLRDQMIGVDGRQRADAYQTTQRDIGSRAAASGSYAGSGSGEYLERAMGSRDYVRDAADAATRIAYDSYGTGAQLAGQNAAARTNALQTAGGADAAMADALFGRASTAGQFRQSAIGNAANYGLSRAGQQNTVANDYISRNLSASGLLGAYGDLQRSYDQQNLDKDWTQFSRVAGFIPGMQGTQTQTQPVNNTGLLGTAATVAGLFL